MATPSLDRFAAVIVAAGEGLRAGQPVPKQFAPWRGKPVVRHAAEALVAAGAGMVAVAIPRGGEQVAREALGELLRHAVRTVRIGDVDAAVCSSLRLSGGALKSKSRTWSVSHARMLAIFLARKHTSATYSEISNYFGNKTHSTAVAAEKTVRGWLDANEPIKAGDLSLKARDLIERVERELFN